MSFKRYPLTESQIHAMKQSSPVLYRDMVEKYGIENVINNLLVDVLVLTEDKPVLCQHGITFHPTREKIKKIAKASNSKFEKYIKNPINQLKGWVVDGKELGYSPVITNHKDTVENRHGFTIGSSYWTKDIDGKLCLFSKQLLISPESKYNYINGIWREVSPTILSDYTISETSFVNIPAQETNTVLSSSQDPYLPEETQELSGITDIIQESQNEEEPTDWKKLIAESKEKAENEKAELIEKHKLNVANDFADKLIRNGIFTSGQKSKIATKLVQLSSGGNTGTIVFDLLNESKRRSLFMNKPRQVFLRGTLDMDLTKEQRWIAFEKQNKGAYSSPLDLRTAFDKAEATTKVSLSSGEAQIIDPQVEMTELCEKLAKMKESGILNKEHMVSLSKAIGVDKAECASMESGKADGKPVESGGTDMPNNTSLSTDVAVEPTPEADNHKRMLERGFQALEEENKKLKDEIEEHKKRHEHLKSILGGEK